MSSSQVRESDTVFLSPPFALYRWIPALAACVVAAAVWMARADVVEELSRQGNLDDPETLRMAAAMAQVMGSVLNAALVVGVLFVLSRIVGAAATLADKRAEYCCYAQWSLVIMSTALTVTAVWSLVDSAGSGRSLAALTTAMGSFSPATLAVVGGVVAMAVRRLPLRGGVVLTAVSAGMLALAVVL